MTAFPCIFAFNDNKYLEFLYSSKLNEVFGFDIDIFVFNNNFTSVIPW